MSDICKTLVRFPLALGAVAFAGLALGNSAVVFNGRVLGAGQKVEPPILIAFSICVITVTKLSSKLPVANVLPILGGEIC